MASVGLVKTFIGLGERGFKTVELKLIEPSLVGCGLLLALLKIFYFFVPSRENEDSEKLIQKEDDLNIFDEPNVDSFHDVAPRPRHTETDQISSRPAVQPAWNTDAPGLQLTIGSKNYTRWQHKEFTCFSDFS